MSVVGADRVRARGVGVNDEAISAAELDELDRIQKWLASPKSELRVILTGLMFLTRIPCPSYCDHHPGFLMLATGYFPIVGSLIGWWSAVFFDAVGVLTPNRLLCACGSTAATLWLTMCFHEDGLADSADAFGGGWSRDEVLTIMKDSRIGTFGGVALILYVVTKLALLSDLGTEASRWVLFGSTGAGPVLVASHALARATPAPLIYSCQYIVDKGDAKGDFYSWFGRSRDLLSVRRLTLSCVTSVIITVVVLGVEAAVLGGLTVAVCCLLARAYGNRILGGVMGDFLGATICLTELTLYFIFATCTTAIRDNGQIRDVRLNIEGVGHLVTEALPIIRLAATIFFLFRVVKTLGTLKDSRRA